LATIGPEMGLAVLAWALFHNHFHLLVRTGERPLATTMRRLLTGYAGGFNRRHKRAGHLFQNRYKSILVEEEPYLLELVRYVHLNPLRARILTTLDMLDEYPWTGHSAVLGRVPRPWQAVGEVLRCFGPVRGLRDVAILSIWPRVSRKADASTCKGVVCAGAREGGKSLGISIEAANMEWPTSVFWAAETLWKRCTAPPRPNPSPCPVRWRWQGC
jgi:REP element-mobilizing transposase RayT